MKNRVVISGYRFYSPELGRWINRDPLGEEGSLNLYAFVMNNPNNYFDILGLAFYPIEENGINWGNLKRKGPPPDPVVEETNKILKEFLNGTPSSHFYGPSHPWTKRLRNHPHMEVIREEIRKALAEYCKKVSTKTSGNSGFDLLTDLSNTEIAKWLFNDAISWSTDGIWGTDRAFIFGSFRLKWSALNITCKKCVASSRIKFNVSDKVRLGSGSRWPWSRDELLPDEPFGSGKPLNSIPISWLWFENLLKKY